MDWGVYSDLVRTVHVKTAKEFSSRPLAVGTQFPLRTTKTLVGQKAKWTGMSQVQQFV